jgi:hypothetical protein
MESKEYKTYTCTKCNYAADVFGKFDMQYNAAFNTFTCKDCHILIECQTADLEFRFNPMEFKPTKRTPTCMMCAGTNVELWNSEECVCPKCSGKMKVTRLI